MTAYIVHIIIHSFDVHQNELFSLWILFKLNYIWKCGNKKSEGKVDYNKTKM